MINLAKNNRMHYKAKFHTRIIVKGDETDKELDLVH